MTMNSLPELSTPWHTLNANEALEVLRSNHQQGLTSQGVAERLERYGPNELQEAAGRSNLTILIDQFKNIMLLMLIAVAVVSATLDIRSALATGAFPFPKDAIAIMTIVILNGILGFVQESGAEKALASLKKLS
ncbi:MAG: cation-transporting P-type ATPase, partial [Leptolyngbyaceae cyanobacterium bins.59]|nr:cation-transporting P-type ATPase [Leptolyngbyaceae cyanobacterium bins.59]